MTPTKLKLLIAAAALVIVLAVAGTVLFASGSSDAGTSALAPTASTTSITVPAIATTAPPAGTPAAPAIVAPDGGRILADVKALADGIGPRPAGTDAEKQAAELIADRLRGLGYDVSFQEFSVATQTSRFSSVEVLTPKSEKLSTYPFDGSAAGQVSGRVVDAGLGSPAEFPADAAGAIALIKRGDLLFSEKVANAVAAGAAAVIIYNSESGIFLGQLGQNVAIPVVSISLEEGEALAGTPSTVDLSVATLSGDVSRNVIAKPPGHDCATVTGGHYDSVVQAPGANDNASGAATVLEIAAVLAGKGEMGDNCFVLFGGEELGLLGSKYYVSQLDQPSKDRLKAMLNFDMVGFGDEAWWLIGTPDLQQRMGALAGQLKIDGVVPSTLIRGLSSDHASFEQAGIPVLMFHRWEDTLLHTPQDVSQRVEPKYLEQAARMGIALLESLSAGG